MGEMTELTAADGHRLQAYQAGEAGAGKALVIVQEIFGVNRHIRAVCDRYAAAGYRVIAPALFDRVGPGIEIGYTPDDVAKARALKGQVADAAAMMDIEAAAKALGDGAKGIVGFCWGGTLAWWGGTRTAAFRAAVGWYGGGIAATRMEVPTCPVQLHFGEQDAGIPLADVDAVRDAQPGIEVFVYDGAGHGFGCDERASFDAAAAKLAQERTLAFLLAHL